MEDGAWFPMRSYAALHAAFACFALAGCANGLQGAPSPKSSPVAASELARQKAMRQAQMESLHASCFPQAVLPNSVKRVPLTPVTATSASPPVQRIAPPLLNAAQAKQLRVSRTLLPVYCRNVEPASVQPNLGAIDKLREAANRFDAAGFVVDPAEFGTTLRVRGSARYAHVESREVGRTETYVDRYGNPSTRPGVTLEGGRRIITPVLAVRVDPVELAESVEVPGRYTEGWVLVRVPETIARLHHATCVLIVGEAEKALAEGDYGALQAHFETIRTCDFYATPIRTRTGERPAIVQFPTEEP